jgi:glutathione S-transferase
MSTPEIVLHQWSISPFCGKVRKVLAYKRLPYRIVEYGGLKALRAGKLAPTGKLPVLDYAGERMNDSTAIARFLESRHPSPSLSAPAEVAPLAHLLEDWADESLYWFEVWARICDSAALDRTVAIACAGCPSWERALFKVGLSRYRRHLDAQGLGRCSSAHIEAELFAHLAALEVRLRASPWLAGSVPTMADVAVSAQLDELVRTSRFADAIRGHQYIAEWLTRADFEGTNQGLTGSAPMALAS